MPELPEVEHVRVGLMRRVVGARVVAVELLRMDVLRSGGMNSSGDGRGGGDGGGTRGRGPQPNPLEGLNDTRVVALHRRGKFLAMEFDRGCLGIHLGMSGRLTLEEPGSPRRTHTHLEALLEVGDPERSSGPSGTSTALLLRFHDPRRFGGLWLDRDVDEHRRLRWASLGPDALGVDAEWLAPRLRGTHRAVKTALLDQRLVAGIGNIYADEILHRAGVDPRTRGDRLAHRSVGRIAAATLEVLQAAVVAGGSTIRDHVGVDGQAGSFEAEHRVYGRAGDVCLACGSTLTGIQLGGRTTVFCRRCQRRG